MIRCCAYWPSERRDKGGHRPNLGERRHGHRELRVDEGRCRLRRQAVVDTTEVEKEVRDENGRDPAWNRVISMSNNVPPVRRYSRIGEEGDVGCNHEGGF